jgi:hypothetical protein
MPQAPIRNANNQASKQKRFCDPDPSNEIRNGIVRPLFFCEKKGKYSLDNDKSAVLAEFAHIYNKQKHKV